METGARGLTSAEVADGLRLLRIHGSGDLGLPAARAAWGREERGGWVLRSRRRRAHGRGEAKRSTKKSTRRKEKRDFYMCEIKISTCYLHVMKFSIDICVSSTYFLYIGAILDGR